MGWGGSGLGAGGGFGVDDGFDNVFGAYHRVGSSYNVGGGGWGNKYLFFFGSNSVSDGFGNWLWCP